jgi:hypothetical protein
MDFKGRPLDPCPHRESSPFEEYGGSVAPMPRPPRSKLTQTGAYRPEVIELALLTLAVEGSAKRAASVVKEQFGVGPS